MARGGGFRTMSVHPCSGMLESSIALEPIERTGEPVNEQLLR